LGNNQLTTLHAQRLFFIFICLAKCTKITKINSPPIRISLDKMSRFNAYASLLGLFFVLMTYENNAVVVKRRLIHGMDKGLNSHLKFLRFLGNRDPDLTENHSKHHSTLLPNKHKFNSLLLSNDKPRVLHAIRPRYIPDSTYLAAHSERKAKSNRFKCKEDLPDNLNESRNCATHAEKMNL